MKKQTSLKWKICKYLVCFLVFTIAIIFLFQVVLLEPMYERSKIQAVKDVSSSVVYALNNDSDYDTIMRMAAQSDTCIQLYTASSNGTSKAVGGGNGCLVYSVTPKEVLEYVTLAENNYGEYLAVDNQEDLSISFTNEEHREQVKNIVYTKIANIAGNTCIIVTSGMITPLSATTTTLRGQMLYIGIFLVLAIVVLTWIIYHQIAKPLVKINQAAKDLPKGIYHIDKSTDCYLEASELNQTLYKASNEIQAADKAKRDLIANVSHDLRTPLTMIGGYGEMMIDLPEEKTDENIKVIVDESKRLNALVNDLLDLSKLQSNQIVLHKEKFNLSDMIEQQLKKYDVYHVQDGFDIEYISCKKALVFADEKRMEQVFNNFMTNAINYSKENRKIIVKEEIKNNQITVSVQDFGEGISKENLSKVWDRYYKIDKEHVRVSNGSGIGLALCKEILELHECKYGVESELNVGSTFYFTFPLVLDETLKK